MHRHAILRKPGPNFAQGITTAHIGMPDYTLALHQHGKYAEALEKLGLSLTVLDADPLYPDGCFVEDTAIITDYTAIITKPGHPARTGEEKKIAEILTQRMPVEYITGSGTVDGGDILRVDQHFYIGRSDRTNSEGAHQLAAILSKYGYATSEVPVSAGLHLKSSATYIGKNNVLATCAFAPYFDTHNIIDVGDEEYAANSVLVNGFVLFAAGFPDTKAKLMEARYQLIELDMSEFRKMDGGLTCLSLLLE